MVENVTLSKHELRCLKKYGWTVTDTCPLTVEHGDGSLASGQAASAVVQSVANGEPNYDELIAYDGRNCNCEKGDEADARGEIHQSGVVRDAQGIYLCRACPDCAEEKLSHYRDCILTGYNQSDVDEPIEAEP